MIQKNNVLGYFQDACLRARGQRVLKARGIGQRQKCVDADRVAVAHKRGGLLRGHDLEHGGAPFLLLPLQVFR